MALSKLSHVHQEPYEIKENAQAYEAFQRKSLVRIPKKDFNKMSVISGSLNDDSPHNKKKTLFMNMTMVQKKNQMP